MLTACGASFSGKPARCRRHRVRLDLRPRHLLARADRRGVGVLERRGDRTDHRDLAVEEARREVSREQLREGQVGDRARLARVVDPLRAGAVLVGQPLERLDGGDGEARQPVDLVGHPPDDAVLVVQEVAVAGARADLLENPSAPEHVCAPLGVHLRGGEDNTVGPIDRIDQRVVVTRVRGLGELDVVRDRLRARLAQRVDRLCVEAARERPALLEVAEGHVVDADHHDVVRRAVAAADVEALVDRVELGAVDHAADIGEDHQAREADGDVP